MNRSIKPQICIRRKYKYPISKVWSAITTKEALSAWLMETDNFDLEIGAKFILKTIPRGNFDGIIHCTVLGIREYNFISYSWLSNGMKVPTTVTWNLKELNNNETLLTLSHDGFVGFDGWITKTMLSFGWKRLLKKKLKKHLAI